MNNSQIKIGAVLSYITIGLQLLIGIFYTPFLTKMLGQSEFGLYSLVSSIISYFTILDFGFGNTIVVFTSKYLEKNKKTEMKKLHGMFLLLYTGIGFITLTIGIVFTFNLDSIFVQSMTPEEIQKGKILMFILTANLTITFPFSIFSNIITAYEKFIFSKTINIIRILLQPILMTPILLFGYKSISLVCIITLINIIVILSNTYYCLTKIKVKFLFKNFDKNTLIEVFSLSFLLFLNQIIDKLNWGVDNFILGAICGTAAVAVYSVALQFNGIYMMFATAISSVLTPKISKMEAAEYSDEEFTNIFIKTGRLQFICVSLIITGFIIFGYQFINILFGDMYEQAYVIGCILMIPVTFHLIQTVGLAILQAKNKYAFRTIVYLIIACLNVLISIYLSYLYGPIGAAIGTGATFLIGELIIMNLYYHRYIHINVIKFWLTIIKMCVPIVILFIVCWIIYLSIGWVNIWVYIAQIITYSLLYTITSWYFVMNDYEKDLIRKPLHKALNKHN